MKQLHTNIKLLYIFSFLFNFRLNAPILILYLESVTHSTTSAMALLSILMIGAAIMEVPTGAIADILGRKKTLLLSCCFGLLTHSLLAIGNSYIILVLSMLAGSAGLALMSGTDAALLYDTLKQLGREADFKQISGRLMTVILLSLSTAAMIGGQLARISLWLPIVSMIVPQILLIGVAALLREPDYQKPEQTTIVQHIRASSIATFRDTQVALLTLIIALFFAVGEATMVLTPQWYQLYISKESIGTAFTFTYIFLALGAFLSHRVSSALGEKLALLVSTCCMSALMFWATWWSGTTVVMLAVASIFFSGLNSPMLSALINDLIESRQRATVISIGGLIQKIFYSGYAVVLGFLADRLGVVSAIRVSALLLAMNVALLAQLRIRRPAAQAREQQIVENIDQPLA